MGINVKFLKLDNEDMREKLNLAESKTDYLLKKNKELNNLIE